MGKLIKLTQPKAELNVNASIVGKIYKMIINRESYGGNEYIHTDSDINGEITISTPTYLEWVEKINEVFPYFIINAPTYYIHFADSYVENALISNGFGDGTGITLSDATTKTFGTIFTNNAYIESFNELKFFTKVNRQGLNHTAFQNCTLLNSVDLSNLENFGGNFIFANCTNLEYFNGVSSEKGVLDLSNYINSTLTDSTFKNCTGITEIRSLGNISTLANHCFQGCTGLTTISQNVLDNISSLGYNVFDGCTYLQIDNLSLPNLTHINNSEGCFSGVPIKKITNLGTVTLVNGFSNCQSLIEVNLPSTCIELGRRAFYEDHALTTINLQNVEEIEGSALFSCTSLEYFKGPNSERGIVDLPNLKYGALGLCGSKVREIRNIGNVKRIADWGFIDCSLLTNIDNILQQLEEIGEIAFWRCPSLIINDLNCPNLKTMGVSVFPGIKIKKISNLGSITKLEREMFQRCTMLTEAVLPETLTQIDSNVFEGCTALESLTILATDPPTLTVSALSNTTCTIYVPSESVEAYRQDTNWSTYAERITAIIE